MMRPVEIVSIGDELLRGITQETNAHWIAKRIAARGADLRRVTLVPDEPETVAGVVREALAREPALLVTHGGLGPTDDDRTREALSLALDRPCERNADAHAIVERRYAELHGQGAVGSSELGEARMRMAMLPAGARALDNQVGTAPGIVLTERNSTIVALPGVPSELYWIWEHPLAPLLDAVLGPGGYAEETFETDLLDESAIAAVLRMVQVRHAAVYVKSRASGFAEGEEVRITLHARGSNDDEARTAVRAAASDLRAAMRADGVVVRGP